MAGVVRQPIDIPSLERYISKAVSEIKIPVDVKQFGFGQSNPTYQLTAQDGKRYVMRKKPPGKLLSKTAHQVEREYRVIHALENTDVPVPKAYCLCEDESVIGTPFYIMGFLDGRIIIDASLPDVSPADRSEMWHDAIRTLAKLHRVDVKAVGLETFGKANGFYNRQISTFGRITGTQAETKDVETGKEVGQIKNVDEMLAFFKNPKTQPKDIGRLIHGDFKIDNLVFHKTEPRVIGILDWEMSTIGHPLSDLVNLLMPYTFASRGASSYTASGESFQDGATPGLPTHKQAIEWYREIAGWDPAPVFVWGEAFGMFRASCIMQGIAARYAARQASSEKAKEHGSMYQPYGVFAWSVIQDAKNSAKDKEKL